MSIKKEDSVWTFFNLKKFKLVTSVFKKIYIFATKTKNKFCQLNGFAARGGNSIFVILGNLKKPF